MRNSGRSVLTVLIYEDVGTAENIKAGDQRSSCTHFWCSFHVPPWESLAITLTLAPRLYALETLFSYDVGT